MSQDRITIGRLWKSKKDDGFDGYIDFGVLGRLTGVKIIPTDKRKESERDSDFAICIPRDLAFFSIVKKLK